MGLITVKRLIIGDNLFVEIAVLEIAKLILCQIVIFEQGNSVARDLPRTGSETNTTIFVIYIYWIEIPTVPNLLSGETTFQLTSC